MNGNNWCTSPIFVLLSEAWNDSSLLHLVSCFSRASILMDDFYDTRRGRRRKREGQWSMTREIAIITCWSRSISTFSNSISLSFSVSCLWRFFATSFFSALLFSSLSCSDITECRCPSITFNLTHYMNWTIHYNYCAYLVLKSDISFAWKDFSLSKCSSDSLQTK